MEPISFSVVGWILSPAIICFSWPFRTSINDLKMAVAVWRMDEDRVRGRGCALFYLVAGCHRVAMVGVGMMALCVFLGIAFRPLRQLLLFESLLGFIVAGITGYLLMVLAAVFAIGYARWYRLRIWIDQEAVPELVLDGRWPPISDYKNNGAYWVVGLPLLLPSVPAYLLMDVSLIAAFASGILAGALILIVIRPVIANHPRECYRELFDIDRL